MYLEKPLESVHERDVVGVVAPPNEKPHLICRVEKVDALYIHTRVVNDATRNVVFIRFDRHTGVSSFATYRIAFVGDVPDGISNDNGLVLGYMARKVGG